MRSGLPPHLACSWPQAASLAPLRQRWTCGVILCDVLSLSGWTSSANPSAPPTPEQLQKDLGPNLVWIPCVGRASRWGLCPGAKAKPRREVATGSSHQLGQSDPPGQGGAGREAGLTCRFSKWAKDLQWESCAPELLW